MYSSPAVTAPIRRAGESLAQTAGSRYLSLVKSRDEFEPRVLEMWLKTQISLTRAHVQFYTGAPRKRLEKWLDEMTLDGVLDVDINKDGDMEWSVIGANRPPDAPTTFDELERLDRIKQAARKKVRARAAERGLITLDASELPVPATALDEDDDDVGDRALSLFRRGKQEIDKRGSGEKNLWLSGGASLFLGPVGWLYAGSFREAIPASLGYLALGYLLPKVLLAPIAGIALPVSGIIGLIYAWQYNRKGKRLPLFLKDRRKKKKRKQIEDGDD